MGRYSFRTEAHRIWHKWLIQFSCFYCFKFKSSCSLPLLYSLLSPLLSLFKKAPFNANEWVTLIVYLDTFQAGSKLCPSLLTYKESTLHSAAADLFTRKLNFQQLFFVGGVWQHWHPACFFMVIHTAGFLPWPMQGQLLTPSSYFTHRCCFHTAPKAFHILSNYPGLFLPLV